MQCVLSYDQFEPESIWEEKRFSTYKTELNELLDDVVAEKVKSVSDKIV